MPWFICGLSVWYNGFPPSYLMVFPDFEKLQILDLGGSLGPLPPVIFIEIDQVFSKQSSILHFC